MINCEYEPCHQATGTNEPHQFVIAGDEGTAMFPKDSWAGSSLSALIEDVHINELQIHPCADISHNLLQHLPVKSCAIAKNPIELM